MKNATHKPKTGYEGYMLSARPHRAIEVTLCLGLRLAFRYNAGRTRIPDAKGFISL